MAFYQPGTFFGLPDIGLSEALGIGAQNPDVLSGGAALYQPIVSPVPTGTSGGGYVPPISTGVDPYAQAAYTQTRQENLGTGQILGTSTTGGTIPTRTTQPSTTQQPTSGGVGAQPPRGGNYSGEEYATSEGMWRWSGSSWEWAGSHADRAAQQQATRQAEEAAINQIYSPLSGILSEQEQLLRGQQPGEEQKIEASYQRGLEGVAGQEAESRTQLGKQTTALEQSRANALAQARQLYSELAQRYGALFGSRTSAGPFAMEILGRETQRQFGNIGTTTEQGRQAVSEETNRMTRWVDTQKNEWQRKKGEALTNLQLSFRQQLAQINAQRGQIESQKAQDRYGALMDVQNKQAMIEQADRQFNQQLALFQAQKQAEFSNVGQFGVADVTTGTRSALGQPFAPATVGPTAQGTTAGYVPQGWEYDPATGRLRKTG